MKKKVISTLLCASMVAAMLAGCGNNAAGNGNAAGNATGNNAGAASSDNGAESTETAQADDGGTASADAIANLIEATTGTVNIQLWCSELEAYQNVMKELTDKFQEE